MDTRDIELRQWLIVQPIDSPPIFKLDYRSPASKPQTMTTLELSDSAAATQRSGKAFAIVSLILSAYTVAGAIALLSAISWGFPGQGSVGPVLFVTLPFAFIFGIASAFAAKRRSNSLLSYCALIALAATVPTAVILLMTVIHNLPNC